SQALAGSAVYMTAYPRLEPGRRYEGHFAPRKWLYQTPAEILIKASNGASDFGNKFGQPLICGSLYTFEYFSSDERFGYDKVIMLAGGIGFAKEEDAVKNKPSKGDRIVVMGGDNYRIGMGGGAVSSVATGEYDNAIELNAVQRANPEMQKRVYNAIRAMSESDDNPVISIHDHGAGGHLNCLSELVEETGGEIELDKLPVGDPTLSAREIIGNESQERMGLVINPDRLELLKKTADRERAPFYDAGKITDDQRFCFRSSDGENPIDWKLEYMFGKPPRTVLKDQTDKISIKEEQYNEDEIPEYINALLEMEAVACKDWLTNKVDRSVTGRVALQQTAGPLQLPLNDAGVSVLDYTASFGIAESIGHAPFAGLLDSAAGSVLSAAEALTNIVWVPLEEGLASVSLSANWMWPAGNEGENARLYKAVEALSNFACDLGINIPTGKDSLSMTQKYPGEDPVLSPGTVIISAAACSDSPADSIKAALSPKPGTAVFYIDFSGMPLTTGGSSFAQLTASSGGTPPTVKDPDGFAARFNALQEFIKEKRVYSGHDISAGGLITALLEMCFPRNDIGIEALLEEFGATSIINILFAENPGVLFQADDDKSTIEFFKSRNIECIKLGTVIKEDKIKIGKPGRKFEFDIPELRDKWYRTSYLFDKMQSGPEKAKERYSNYSSQPLTFSFPESFEGAEAQSCVSHDIHKVKGPKAAIIREKGINGDREMAYSMYCAGFEVKDVHMTDLISGREDLSDIKFLVFPGGFSNSDVLGSAKGWAGAFMYNDKARKALDNFYARTDTLSLGVCNGCQLMIELGLIYPDAGKEHPKMLLNDSKKFESSFLNVDVPENNSIMLKTLSGSRLGVWVAHGEGKFSFPLPEDSYDIALKYSYDGYPGNPNGSAFNAAGVVSKDGRHLAMMPHLERAVFPWQWGYYPEERAEDKVTPWAEAFVNARNWIENKS
ncbi:MAG: phosphoribosylformylglycinamidine synthase, partial [Fibrobacterota bacterium]